MLSKIREQATGGLAWVVVILISIPFALWGIQSYFGNPAEIPVATVNGEKIPLYVYQNELSRQRQALLQQSDGAIDSALLESPEMRNRVVESMIASRLMGQYVRERDYHLSDERLRQRIQSTELFSRDGQFDAELYRDLLRRNGFTPQAYEAAERQVAVIELLSSSVTDSAFVSEREVERLLQLQAQTRTTDYVIVPTSRFDAEIDIDDAAVEQYYQDNLSSYQSPARIKVDYIELAVDDLARGVEPSESEIQDSYRQNRERYKQAETRRASHILFAVDADAEQAERDEALAEAEKVLAESRADDADFADLAQRHSDDPGSKENGGDLGVVTRGQMVAPFEEAVFDMVEDEIRGPIETRFGYHIIKLTELREEQQQPLDEVREEVAEAVRRAQAENLFSELGETFENRVFESPDSLAIAADDLGLKIKQTDWFTADAGEGLADEAAVRRAAFSEDVLDEDLNSAAIELGFDHLVALHKADYEEARPQPFESVRDSIEQNLKLQQSSQRARQLGEQLVADLKAGQGDWAGLLAERQLESQALAETRDEVSAELAELGEAVFAQAAPADGEIVYGGVALGNGDYAVYALEAVIPGDVESVDEAERSALRQRLLARDGDGLYQQLRQTIRQNADVTIDRQTLENPNAAYQSGYR